jgi:hypothetical protein
MMMNRDAYIAKDPYKKSSYFLSLVDGPNVDGWTQQQIKWLKRVEDDPTLLPWRMNAWEVLEQEFHKAFIDYAEHERARDQLKKLRMKGGDVDGYIAEFQDLTNRTGSNIDDGYSLELFSKGLPLALATTCINLNKPDSFDEWVKAAQSHQQGWLRIQALKGNYGTSQPPNRPPNSSKDEGQKGNFNWRSRGQNNQTGRSRQFTPRDPNAMDTSSTVRKAITEAEKKEHREKGKCFECSRQGHLARDCPNRKPRINVKMATDGSNASTISDPPDYTLNAGDAEITCGNTLADFALKLSGEERDAFVRKMMSGGEDMGFLEA